MSVPFSLASELDQVPEPKDGASTPERDTSLGQYFLPAWVGEALFDQTFPELGAGDLVWDPAVGGGATLAAIPAHIGAIGTEVDERWVRFSAERTGRRVIHGSMLDVPLPNGITAIFGNPPFEIELIDGLLRRAEGILAEGRKCGLVLSGHITQTSRNVVRWNQRWTLEKSDLPRDLFPGLKRPLGYVIFTRDRQPHLIGFRLYHELRQIRDLPECRQALLQEAVDGPRSVWLNAVKTVMKELGGRVSLQGLYDAFGDRRPTDNMFWKEQIRKVCQEHLVRVERGIYELPCAA